jgi:Uma2 family endonuclease
VTTRPKATIEDLYNVPENRKAEIVNGELVVMEPTGFWPGRASLSIASSLRDYERINGTGFAIADNVGFSVDLPNRGSFSPDAAFYVGQPSGMRFLEGAPIFAVEIRSEHDYGPAAEQKIAAKRTDYFAAGTVVAWDVDLLGDDVIKSYVAGGPRPTVFRRGQLADAEPALPGWQMPVDHIFE